MAWTYYASTDASAPTLNGTSGAFITVLDAILVNGYGAKAAAGWTKEYSGTNLAAYKMGSGRLRAYLKVTDDASGTGGAKEAQMNPYESMTGISTGTNSWGGCQVRKSDTADSTTRHWAAVADDRTFIFCPMPTVTGFSYLACFNYFGEFVSYVPNDDWPVIVIGRQTPNTTATNIATTAEVILLQSIVNTFTATTGHHVARDSSGVYKYRNYGKLANFCHQSTSNNGASPWIDFPNPADGGAVLSPFYLRDQEPSGLDLLRGRLRGVWFMAHAPFTMFGLNAGETFNGTGDWAGKTFLHPMVGASSDTNFGGFVLETSDTVPRN